MVKVHTPTQGKESPESIQHMHQQHKAQMGAEGAGGGEGEKEQLHFVIKQNDLLTRYAMNNSRSWRFSRESEKKKCREQKATNVHQNKNNERSRGKKKREKKLCATQRKVNSHKR